MKLFFVAIGFWAGILLTERVCVSGLQERERLVQQDRQVRIAQNIQYRQNLEQKGFDCQWLNKQRAPEDGGLVCINLENARQSLAELAPR